MIIKVNYFDIGWELIGEVTKPQWIDHRKTCGDLKSMIHSHKDVEKMWDDGVNVFFANVEKDGYPFEVGMLTYHVKGETDPQHLSWRGHLYLMNDDGKTIESLYVAY